ncbi:MAG: hypothetical protein C4524_00615 [Candidatus Zixiibacteriota bacterium]|nr:MAG: hypothetical protein C4524_00615 [candidate division Zixibacteria bacterium]
MNPVTCDPAGTVESQLDSLTQGMIASEYHFAAWVMGPWSLLSPSAWLDRLAWTIIQVRVLGTEASGSPPLL